MSKNNVVGEYSLKEIFAQFNLEGQFLDAEIVPLGHIHDTFIVHHQIADQVRRTILQRINQHVFPNLSALTHNLTVVSQHLSQKIQQAGGDPNRECLQLIPSQLGEPVWQSPKGEAWRAFPYIEGTYSVGEVATVAEVQAAAQGFGRFQTQLSDFDPALLKEAIPDFHHTPRRMTALQQAIGKASFERIKAVAEEIGFVAARANQLSLIVDRLEAGKLPIRVTHSDTKLNNVLLDQASGQAVCVVDLDTLMAGTLLYDFGDGIRSAAKTAAEDTPDVAQMHLDLDIYAAFAEGFLSEVSAILTEVEIECLQYSAWLMTLESGIRFLTDYLLGDVYFKTDYPEHNTHRTRTQLKLVDEMENKQAAIKQIITRALS